MTIPSFKNLTAFSQLLSRIVVSGELPPPTEWEPPDADDDVEGLDIVKVAGDAAQATLARLIERDDVRLTCEFAKVDEERHQVFGWISIVSKDGEPIVDRQGDVVEPAEMESAAYRHVCDARVAKAMHGGEQGAELIESVFLSKAKQDALGIDLGLEGWWGGWQITDDATWDRIKKGELRGMSIGGRGKRTPIE